jgi:hypothetical protein
VTRNTIAWRCINYDKVIICILGMTLSTSTQLPPSTSQNHISKMKMLRLTATATKIRRRSACLPSLILLLLLGLVTANASAGESWVVLPCALGVTVLC